MLSLQGFFYARRMERDNRDNLDLIVQYLIGNIEKLSKPLLDKLERLHQFDAAIRQYGNRHKVIRLMVSKFKEEFERSYSIRAAMADYEATEYVFGTSMKHNREYHIGLLLANIAETREVAKITKNAAAMARCDQNRMAVIEKFLGDKDTPIYEDLRIPTQIFTADPKALGIANMPDDEKLQAELEKLRKTPREQGAIDVEYQSIEEDE